MRFLLALLAAWGMAVPVQAQMADPGIVQGCFYNAGPGDSTPSCIGQAAGRCQDAGFDTTIGIAQCIQAETVIWDQLLNQSYQSLRSNLRRQDAALADTLRDAQRAWIAYRDAECTLEYARWGGTIRTIVGANCLLLETAERAIELRDKGAN